MLPGGRSLVVTAPRWQRSRARCWGRHQTSDLLAGGLSVDRVAVMETIE